MKKVGRRAAALLLALTMAISLGVSAGAFDFPDGFWPLTEEWTAAESGNDPDRVIDVARRLYELLIPSAPDFTVYSVLEPKCDLASWASEVGGDLDGAVLWLERQLEMDRWFVENGRPDYRDQVLNGTARLDYLRAAQEVTVYAMSDLDASPYSVGPETGVWYGMVSNTDRAEGSAAMLYLDFQARENAAYWIDYYSSTGEHFKRALSGGVIECAWNYDRDAGSRDVLSADSYIEETLATLGGLSATVLLRPGAEVNNWGDADAELYIEAFRKIASAARKYPNLQMVYSPDMINNRNVTAAMYYPGDEYVDWVGVSAYHRSNYHNDRGVLPGSYDMDYRHRGSYGNDAYYGQGFYDYDPLVGIKHVVDLAKERGKPMMISECGFTNTSVRYGDATEYARDQLTKFYSYLNMVYPEVKAVFYFDQNKMNTAEEQDYSITDKPVLESAYHAAIRGNGSYLEKPDGAAAGWEPLDETRLDANTGTLRLATYASFPGVANATVSYYVDGILSATVNEAPYYYELDTSKLSVGTHTVEVVATGGQFTRTKAYTLDRPAYVAHRTNDKLTVNGKPAEPAVYKIDGANYFRLRDVAMLLNGTSAQFSVGYDPDKGVLITTGEAYTPLGLELTGTAEETSAAIISNDSVFVNGERVTPSAFKIENANYFKIRDLGELLGFTVDWSPDTGVSLKTER